MSAPTAEDGGGLLLADKRGLSLQRYFVTADKRGLSLQRYFVTADKRGLSLHCKLQNGGMYMIPFEHYEQSAAYLREKLGGFQPDILLILGSGLGDFGERVEAPISVPYAEIPHFKYSTVPGHKGRFVFGTLAGKNVAVMQGRLHLYEGWSWTISSKCPCPGIPWWAWHAAAGPATNMP